MIAPETRFQVDALLDEIDASLSTLKSDERIDQETDARSRRGAGRDSALKRLSVLLTVRNARWTVGDFLQRLLDVSLPMTMEIIVVDAGSSDGTSEFLAGWAEREPRLHAINSENGSCGAIRASIQAMTGDIAIIQNIESDFDPEIYRNMLRPILRGEADAVFGSCFAGDARRVISFRRSLAARYVTGLFNLINDLNLTDVEAPCKAVRAELLQRLKLRGNAASLHAELATRLAQSGARITEIPLPASRTAVSQGISGKLRAMREILRCRFLEPCFTEHSGQFILSAVARAHRYNAWLLQKCAPFLGQRLLEAGAGIGNLSTRLTERERLVLVDYESSYVSRLQSRFRGRSNIRVMQADLTESHVADAWKGEKLDTIFCSNVLEHLEPDVQVLRSFYDSLTPEGHCIIIVPAEQSLYMPIDRELGHFRRYSQVQLRSKLEQAGFEVVFTSQFCKIGALAWWWNGRVLNRRHLSPRQMIWFDRLWPIARHLDRLLPVPGMSLVMVGRRS